MLKIDSRASDVVCMYLRACVCVYVCVCCTNVCVTASLRPYLCVSLRACVCKIVKILLELERAMPELLLRKDDLRCFSFTAGACVRARPDLLSHVSAAKRRFRTEQSG